MAVSVGLNQWQPDTPKPLRDVRRLRRRRRSRRRIRRSRRRIRRRFSLSINKSDLEQYHHFKVPLNRIDVTLG